MIDYPSSYNVIIEKPKLNCCKVPNRELCGRGERRSSTSQGMLPGHASYQRKPYMDDEEKEEDKALETVKLVERETPKTTRIGTILSPEMRTRLI